MCSLSFRPVFFAITLLNDCLRCDGWGWVEEHEFTGDNENECTVCGFSKIAHWEEGEYIDEDGGA